MPSAKKGPKKDKPPPVEKPPPSTIAEDYPRLYYSLTAGPPCALLCLVIAPRRLTTCFALWGLYQYIPLPWTLHVLGGRAITTYGAWRTIDPTMFPFEQWTSRLIATILVGLLMGVAYRNVMHALNWLMPDMIIMPRGSTKCVDGMMPTRGTPRSTALR